MNLGSGGDDRSGGGAVILTVTGETRIEGNAAIRADGSHNGNVWLGMGAGGSVFLTTGTLSGSGTIQANGGSDSPFAARGGGGGRVAVILTETNATFGNFSGAVVAYGGDDARDGAAGTVYLQRYDQQPNSGSLIIANFDGFTENNGVWTTLNDATSTGVTVGSILVDSGATFKIGTGDTLTTVGVDTTITVDSDATIFNSGSLVLGGTGFTVSGTFTNDEYSVVTYQGQDDDSDVSNIIDTTYNTLQFTNTGTTFPARQG